jgi:hypothetical protein
VLGDPAPTPFDRGLLRLGHDLRRLGDDPARHAWHHVRRPRALLVAELADARSMSAGESVSRATMFRLNLPRPELQVPVEDAAGLIGVADFGWEGVVGEFDGRRTYAVGVVRAGDDRTPAGIQPRRGRGTGGGAIGSSGSPPPRRG